MLVWALTMLPVAAIAQTPLDIATPQIAMSKAVSIVANERAQQIGLSQDAVTYCRIKLNYEEDRFPQNGEIPFGVNYNNITDPKELAQVIQLRESYEKTYMLLCLSRIKQQFDAAK